MIPSRSTEEDFRALLEREKLDALAEFAAGCGHEFNNPLAIIGGHAQMILRQTDDPRTKRHLSVILSQVQRAYEMIADIRLYARPPKPNFARLDLSAWLDGFGERTALRYPDWKGRFCADSSGLPVEGSSWVTDRAILETIVAALTKNAVEADPAGVDGVVHLSGRIVTERENRLELVLEDNGPGIDSEIESKIFSPYFSGRSSGRGLGFGLPLAASLARALGGELRLIRPELFSTGCRFVLTLPTETEAR